MWNLIVELDFVDVLSDGLIPSVGRKLTNSGYYYSKTKTEAVLLKTRYVFFYQFSLFKKKFCFYNVPCETVKLMY